MSISTLPLGPLDAALHEYTEGAKRAGTRTFTDVLLACAHHDTEVADVLLGAGITVAGLEAACVARDQAALAEVGILAAPSPRHRIEAPRHARSVSGWPGFLLIAPFLPVLWAIVVLMRRRTEADPWNRAIRRGFDTCRERGRSAPQGSCLPLFTGVLQFEQCRPIIDDVGADADLLVTAALTRLTPTDDL